MTTENSRADALTRIGQFLTDVVTAAGLLSHGRTDKKLATRISGEADELRKHVHLLAASPVEQPAAAPIDLQGLRRSILTTREIMRDQDGMLSHHAVPYLDEDVNYETFFAAFGIEAAFIHMEDDVDGDTYDRYFASNSANCSMWTPSAPTGDGWLLLEIYDTEDGPVALYVREKKSESMRERWKREKRESDAAAPSPADERAAKSISDEMMDLVDRLGGEYDKVDPRAWRHLLVYAPKPEEMDVLKAPVEMNNWHGRHAYAAGWNDCRKIAARAASANETGAEGATHAPAGYGLTAEQLATLQSNGLKPEEIGGNASTQHDRVRELVHWFARFARGEANPKWAHAHAFELAYFIASNGQNRHIDLREIADKAYLEGVNISASDRSILERLGKIASQPAPAAIPAGFALAPIEPTPEILTAIWQNERDSRRAWERAIATVQQPAQADARVGLTIPDTTRALLLNVLWHHQGGSSEVSQPIRKILGIGEHDHLTGDQLTEAKRIERLVANEPMEDVIQRENDRLRADLKRRTDIEQGHCWYWIGDGCDELESLTCQVIIKAADLRALLAAHPGQPEPRAEVTALIAAAEKVVSADRACALDDSDINALANAIDAARTGASS